MAAKYTFTRPTPAYLSDGTQVAENIPRLEPSQMVYGKAIMMEEGTENLLVKDLNTGGIGSIIDILVPNKVWAKRITVEANNYFYFGTISVPAQPNTKYTLTYWARLVSGSVVRGTQIYIGSDSQGIQGVATLPIYAELTSEWKKFVITGQTDANATTLTRATFRVETNTGCTVEIADWQLEAKPYPTSFVDGTRAAETLTIPTEGVLNPQEGTVEFWVKKSAPNRVTGNCFFATTGTKRWDAWFNAGGKIFGLYNENSGGWLYASISGTFPLNSWQHIAITWNSSGQRLYYNGQLVGVNTSTPIDFGNTIYIGSYKSTSYESNTLIDDLRISNRARTDAEILAAYQGGQPAAVDESTTLKLNFDPFDNADIMIYNDGLVLPFYMQSSRNTKWQLIAPARDDTEEKEAADGDVDFGTTLANSELSLHGIIEYESIQDKNTKKAALAARLNDCRNKKLLALESNPDIGIYVRLKGRPEITEYPSWMDITIPFSTEPFWQSIEEHYRVGSGILTNNGTFETPLTIEIAGPATNPSVVIGSDTLTYTGTINAGQTLVIDTEAKTAKIGSTNALGNYNGVFPTLPPGDTDVTAGSNVTIKWRDRWL